MSRTAHGRYTPPSRGKRVRNGMLAVGAAVISSGLTMGLEAGASPPKAPVMSTKTFYACIEGGEIIGVEAMPFTPQFCATDPGQVLTQITGPQGAQGVQGTQGFQGTTGATGATGVQGAQGSQGNQGSQGLTGSQGSTGSQGTQGSQRTTCDQGAQGFQGPSGAQGFQGNQGFRGAQGNQGNQGTQGNQGFQGFIGAQGAQGFQGFTGVQGAQGFQGFRGVQGFQGTQGFQGNQGFQGTTGVQGTQGFQGNQGLQGVGGNAAEFFAVMPPDNAATVAAGAAVAFPENGSNTGASIVRLTSSLFQLSNIGTYEVSFQVSVTEAGQLQLDLNSFPLGFTVVGRATGTSEIVGQALVTTTTINSTLSVINPSGESTALSVTPFAGGVDPVSASLIIQQIG